MKFKFPMFLTMITALAFLTVNLAEVQAQQESYGSAAPTTPMAKAAPAPAPVCCQRTTYSSNEKMLYPVPQTGPIPSYRAVKFARENPDATYSPYAKSLVHPPVTHRGMTYIPLFAPRSTQRSFFRFRRGGNGYGY